AFLVDTGELDQIERQFGHFNLFEALGVVRQELRHSDFLAFLVNPRQTRRLGPTFLKSLLHEVLRANEHRPSPVTRLDIELADWSAAVVYREWHAIDLVVLLERERLAVLVENKIDSAEHSDQLRRYLAVASQELPNWRLLPVYLTPDGALPSNDRYLVADYSM